jgi:hypothetical protein
MVNITEHRFEAIAVIVLIQGALLPVVLPDTAFYGQFQLQIVVDMWWFR